MNITAPEPTPPPDNLEQRVAALEQFVSEKLAKKDKAKKPGLVDWLKALGPILIAFVGIYFTSKQQDIASLQQAIATKSSIWQAHRELQSSREQADSDLRAKMFEILSSHFFMEPSQSRDKILLLGLLDNNFQDFNAGPLYELLNSSLTNKDDQEAVRRLARTAAARQVLTAGTGIITNITLGTKLPAKISLGQTNNLEIIADAIHYAESRVDLEVHTSRQGGSKTNNFSFSVSYFDMPLSDSTLLPDGRRFTVTLADIDTNPLTATLNVIELKTNYLSPHERPEIGQLTSKWKTQIEAGN